MPAPEIDAAPVAEEFGALARLGRLYAERLTQGHLLLLRLAADEFFEARPSPGPSASPPAACSSSTAF
jgi:hypothetical protein